MHTEILKSQGKHLQVSSNSHLRGKLMAYLDTIEVNCASTPGAMETSYLKDLR